IRNRLKVAAAIHNAGVVRAMRASHGGFAAWLDAHVHEADGHPRDKAAWVKLFKRTFRFTGGEITGEFLMSLATCPARTAPTARSWPRSRACAATAEPATRCRTRTGPLARPGWCQLRRGDQPFSASW